MQSSIDPIALAQALRNDLANKKYEQETPEYWNAKEARVVTPFYGFDHVTLVRAHGDEHRAVVRVEADPAPGAAEVTIELLDSAQGIAPGQAAVVYDGSHVVGSCTISATARSAALAGRGAR